ncbi:E3 ubiquitin-protein ligase TRIM56-like [Sycon ciliatum]|uniref:E3 ubiquitin-protein ligase TRIM56-like n=1 Tax=Sycon ciliatum TaxID=27933 RepID=UPI0031F6CA85
MATAAKEIEEDQAMAGLKCASCDQPPRDGRLIRCLHTLCALCVEPHIKDDNTIHCPNCAEITPSPGQGRSQLQSLPRAYCPIESSAGVDASASYSTRSARVVCEECDEEEAATFKCHDCSMLYCTDHGKGHLKSKSTKSHRTERICEDAATSSNRSEQTSDSHTPRCPLHPTSSLEWQCVLCKEFLCERCRVTSKRHVCHLNRVLTIAHAARDARTALQKKASDQASNALTKIGQAHTAAKAANETIDNAHKAMSTEIQEQFSKLEKVLEERRDELLQAAHQKYWQQSSVVERHVEKLRRKKACLTRTQGLLEDNVADSDFLRLEPWLLDALSESETDVPLAMLTPTTPWISVHGFDKLAQSLRKVGVFAEDTHYSFSRTQYRHRDLVFSNADCTLKRVTGGIFQSACMYPFIAEGAVATTRVRVGDMAEYLWIGVCDPSRFENGQERQAYEVSTWGDDTAAMPFKKADTVCLMVDRQRKILSLHNETSGKKWTAKSELCETGVLAFYVKTQNSGVGVTILQP